MVYWTSIISSIVLATTVVVAKSPLSKRAINVACPLNNSTWTGEVFTSFTAITFDSFITCEPDIYDCTPGSEIEGALGVGNLFRASNYLVNSLGDVDCSLGPDTTFSDYGLVVIGETQAENVGVNGYASLLGGGDTSGVHELLPACGVTSRLGYGTTQLKNSKDAAILSSSIFSNVIPNYVMDRNGQVTKIRESTYKQFAVFTFDVCSSADQCALESMLPFISDPSGFLYSNRPDFTGLQGDIPGDDVTVVFNIPVPQNTELTITNKLIALAVNSPCYTIFNIYPVDSKGNYDYGGVFSFNRNFEGTLPGFVLAPQGDIIDSANGNFQGQFIANSYRWSEENPGASIRRYDQCSHFQGCLTVKENLDLISTVTVTKVEGTKTVFAEGPTVYVMPYKHEYHHQKKKGWGNKHKGSGWDGKNEGGYNDWYDDGYEEEYNEYWGRKKGGYNDDWDDEESYNDWSGKKGGYNGWDDDYKW